MADALRKELGVEVEVVNGNRGELSVLVDDQVVARKALMIFKPSVQKVVNAVKEATGRQPTA